MFDIKQVTRYVLTNNGKDVAEFKRRDEAEKASAALNDVREETTMDGRPARCARARIGGITYKYGYITEGLTPADIGAKDAEVKRSLLNAIALDELSHVGPDAEMRQAQDQAMKNFVNTLKRRNS